MGSDVVAVRHALGNALDVVLGVASEALCVKCRTAVRLDCALESQPAGLALDTLLAAKNAVLHLRAEFNLVAQGPFGMRCADNRNAPRTIIGGAAAHCARGRVRSLVHGCRSRPAAAEVSLGLLSVLRSACAALATWAAASRVAASASLFARAAAVSASLRIRVASASACARNRLAAASVSVLVLAARTASASERA